MDAEPLILSALNDYLYCPRRCAIHRLEEVWQANASTVSGELAHTRADDAGYRIYRQASESAGAGKLLRVERALWLYCRRLNLAGKADIVEFRADPAGGPDVPVPVDYKLGRRRKWDNDDVQLCAQGLCLEEMFGVRVPGGAVYHVATRRRREVPFDAALRGLTERTVEAVRRLLAAGRVPPAEPKPQCQGCSVHGVCLPELTQSSASLDRAHADLFVATDRTPQPGEVDGG